MSAALRLPWRAIKSDPVTVIGKTSIASTLGSSSRLTAKSPLRSSPFVSAAGTPSWGCTRYPSSYISTSSGRCFSTRTSTLFSQVQSEGDTRKSGKKGGLNRKVIVLAIVGLLGVGAVTLSPDAKHAYEAAKRSGRVAGTLAVCINE